MASDKFPLEMWCNGKWSYSSLSIYIIGVQIGFNLDMTMLCEQKLLSSPSYANLMYANTHSANTQSASRQHAIYTCNYAIINANLGIKHSILMHVIII